MSKKNIIKGTLILSATGFLTKFLGFIFRIVLSRKISAPQVGTFQLVLPVMSICYGICISGIELTLSKRTASIKNNDANTANAVHCTLLSILLGIICSFILFLFSNTISKFYLHNESCSFLLKAFSFSIPFTCVHAMFYAYNIGKEKSVFPAVTQLIEQFVRIIVLIVITKKYAGAISAVIASIIGELASVFLCVIYFFIKKNRNFKLVYSPSLFISIIKSAFPITLNRIIINIVQSTEIAFIPLMLELFGYSKEKSLSYLGLVTGMALPMILFPITLINSFSLMLIPVISKNKQSKDKIKNYYKIALYSSSVLGLLCTFFFLLIGGKITAFIFSNSHLMKITKLLSFICPFLFVNVSLKTILNSLDKSINVLFNNLLSETVCLGFIVFLIPKFGINAYIWGLILSQTVNSLLCIHTIRKSVKQN